MTITLDTPEQISMWVLLSRRAQLKLQMKGIKVPGIVKWCRENIEGCENARTAKACVVPVEYAISQGGAEVDYSLVNLHIMARTNNPAVFQDMGIYNSPDDISEESYLGQQYKAGNLEIVLTMDEPRGPNGEMFVSA